MGASWRLPPAAATASGGGGCGTSECPPYRLAKLMWVDGVYCLQPRAKLRFNLLIPTGANAASSSADKRTRGWPRRVNKYKRTKDRPRMHTFMNAGDLGRTHDTGTPPRVATETDSPAVAPVFFVANHNCCLCCSRLQSVVQKSILFLHERTNNYTYFRIHVNGFTHRLCSPRTGPFNTQK